MSDEDEVREIEEHWPVAMQARDGRWLREHTTEGLVVTQPDGSLLDREAYLAHREFENDTIIEGVNVAERVEVVGDAAVVINRGQFLTESAVGVRSEMLIRGTTVYLRSDDGWRAAAMHLSEHSGSREAWGENLIEIKL